LPFGYTALTLLKGSPMSERRHRCHTTFSDRLSTQLTAALDTGGRDLDVLGSAGPADERDRFETLLTIYDLHHAPLDRIGPRARWQHHPVVAAIKNRCESEWLAELELLPVPAEAAAEDPATALRAMAARDRLPEIYRWLARDADRDDLVTFLALEGGPDAGFDDLVAVCQVGLSGSAKLELATNYWDEMGNGDGLAVHTVLHNELVESLGLPCILTDEQPVSALARAALCGLLATNRWLQPELLGALGLIELQAGPRCQLVLQALRRCDAPAAAFPFYEVHADVDPRHGKDWVEKAVVPTVAAHPEWKDRIIRGAHWRGATNTAFLDDLTSQLVKRAAALNAVA
jgi:hypothetical protein